MFLSVPTFVFEVKKRLGTTPCTLDCSTGWRQVMNVEYIEATPLPNLLYWRLREPCCASDLIIVKRIPT